MIGPLRKLKLKAVMIVFLVFKTVSSYMVRQLNEKFEMLFFIVIKMIDRI
jgi:hypothetical protein